MINWLIVTIIGIILFVLPIVKYNITKNVNALDLLVFCIGFSTMMIGTIMLTIYSFKIAHVIISKYYIG